MLYYWRKNLTLGQICTFYYLIAMSTFKIFVHLCIYFNIAIHKNIVIYYNFSINELHFKSLITLID